MDVTEACRRVHEMLESLPKWREPSNNLPKNGIYFFYEGVKSLNTQGSKESFGLALTGKAYLETKVEK